MKDTHNQGRPLQERLSEAGERWENATISDIIAAKRREADSIEQSARGSFKVGESWDDMPFTEVDLDRALDLAAQIRKEADRLEAAHKRELSKICPKTGGDFGQFGNGAKMREALENARSLIYEGIATEVDDAIEHPFHLELAIENIEAALAEPVKNCEVGTAEEQEDRFGAFCKQHSKIGARGLCDERCPILADYRSECALRWAQMPYEKGGAK